MVQREISEEEKSSTRLGATPSRLMSDPPPSSPHFYTGCPSWHKHLNLSWLGTGTKHAGLHTQWQCKWLQSFPLLPWQERRLNTIRLQLCTKCLTTCLQNLLDTACDLVMFLADYVGVEDSRGGVERVDGWIDAELCNATGQDCRGIQVGKCCSRGRVGQVISRHVDCLHTNTIQLLLLPFTGHWWTPT